MDFTRLPIYFSESILSHCDLGTINKMKRSCSSVNKIIKRKKFDTVDIEHLEFVKSSSERGANLLVYLEHCDAPSPKKSQSVERSYSVHKKNPSGTIDEKTKQLKINAAINRKIRQVLGLVRSVKSIFFYNLRVDGTLLSLIKSIPIKWNEVTAEFRDCYYSIPKGTIVSLSKIFKSVSVNEFGSKYLHECAESFDDTFIGQILPTVSFDSSNYFEAPNITDKIFQVLEEKRPPTIQMNRIIPSYTVDGIIQFFKKMLSLRYSSIDNWCIGTVRLNEENYAHLCDQFDDGEWFTEYSGVRKIDEDERCIIKMLYQKENCDNLACIAVILIKPKIFVIKIGPEWDKIRRIRRMRRNG